MNSWRLLLTRSAEDCDYMARTLATHGLYAYGLPLLAIQPLAENAQERAQWRALDSYQAVIVLSKPAAHLAGQRIGRYWPKLPPGPRWFAIGPGTAAVLAEYGIQARWPPGGDSESLLALPELGEALQSSAPRALLLRGENGRELIERTLRGRDVGVAALDLYRRTAPEYAPGVLAATVRAHALNGLVVSSGQVLQRLAGLCGPAWSELSGVALFVPSRRVANLARGMGFGRVILCHGAQADALLRSLRENIP